MEVRINKRWIIFTPKNDSSIVLGDIPENMQDGELNVCKLPTASKRYYTTVFGAVQSLVKYEIVGSDVKSLLDLEQLINKTAIECEVAFHKAKKNEVA